MKLYIKPDDVDYMVCNMQGETELYCAALESYSLALKLKNGYFWPVMSFQIQILESKTKETYKDIVA